MMHTMPHRNPWHPLHRTLLPDGFVCLKLAAADFPDHPAEVHFPPTGTTFVTPDYFARFYAAAVVFQGRDHESALAYAYGAEVPSRVRIIPR